MLLAQGDYDFMTAPQGFGYLPFLTTSFPSTTDIYVLLIYSFIAHFSTLGYKFYDYRTYCLFSTGLYS